MQFARCVTTRIKSTKNRNFQCTLVQTPLPQHAYYSSSHRWFGPAPASELMNRGRITLGDVYFVVVRDSTFYIVGEEASLHVFGRRLPDATREELISENMSHALAIATAAWNKYAASATRIQLGTSAGDLYQACSLYKFTTKRFFGSRCILLVLAGAAHVMVLITLVALYFP